MHSLGGSLTHAGDFTTATSVLTISFFNSSGSRVSVDGLTEPAVIDLPITRALPNISGAPVDVICAFWDTDERRWSMASVGRLTLVRGQTVARCNVTHFTDFSAFFGRLRPVASLRETFNLAGFVHDNWVGLLISVTMLAFMLAVFVHSLRRYKHGRLSVTATEITSSAYARSWHDLHNRLISVWPFKVAIMLRTKWTCGSLWFPLAGDPYDRPQRLLTVCCTVLVSLTLNLLFFQSAPNLLDGLNLCLTCTHSYLGLR